jgi:PKD repeat protein
VLIPVVFGVTALTNAPWAFATNEVDRASSVGGLQLACAPCPSPPGGCFNSVTDCLGVYPSASPSSGLAPLSVYFGEKLYNGLGGYTYSWTFGDGGTSTAANPSHTYTAAGTYYAVLKVTESGGHYSSGSVAVTASCTPTTIDGSVVVAGSSYGVYGATVTLGLGGTTQTNSGGQFSFGLGCSTATSSTLTVSAPGYYGTKVSASWTLKTTTQLPAVQLKLFETNALESQSTWYNVSACLASGCAPLTQTPYSSQNVSSVSVATQTACSTCSIPLPPSGDSSIVVLSGHDSSNFATVAHPQEGYLEETIMTIPLGNGFPLSAPMIFAFNIYVAQAGCSACAYPLDTSNFTVDLEFTDGTFLSTVMDDTDSPILDGNGTQIGYDYWELPVGTWVRMAFDLSELRDKSVKSILLYYNNHGGGACGSGFSGCSGNFEVAFDNIRFEMPHYSTSIADGGFELPALDGWSIAGTLSPQLETTTVHSGSQAVLLGNTTCPTTVGKHGSCITYNTILIQPFRIPTNLSSVSIGFVIQAGNHGGSTDFQRIWLNDRTTLTDTYLLGSATSGPLSTSGAWQGYSVDVTALEGHDVWLEIEVAHNVATTQGDWMYVDSVYLLPDAAQFSEGTLSSSSTYDSATAAYDGSLSLAASPYLTSPYYEQNIPLGVGSGIRHIPGCVGSGGCTGADVVALAVDFSSQEPSWDYCTGSCGNSNTMWLDLSSFASTSLVLSTNQGPLPAGISQITLTASIANSGATTGTDTAIGGSEYEENLVPGYPVTQSSPPSPWDVVIGGIEVALPFLLPGVGELADIGIEGLTLATAEASSAAGLHGLQWALDSTPVTRGVSGSAGSCSGASCQFSWSSPSYGPTEGGGTALVGFTTAAGGGSWVITVSTTVTLDWQGSTIDTLTTSYDLNISV